jgi:Putative prokaryotic signal transducing protein
MFAAILENEGIPCFTQNSATEQSLAAGLSSSLFPIPEFWPALCVLNDDDYPQAMKVLTELRKSDPAPGIDWKCASCGEMVPGNFTSCWNCQAARESERS